MNKNTKKEKKEKSVRFKANKLRMILMITIVSKMKVVMKLQDKVYYQVLMTQDFGKFELRKIKKELL